MYFCVAPTAAPVANHPNKLVSSSPNKTPAVKPAAPPTKGFTVDDNKYLTAKTIISVVEWEALFLEIGYTGDYYWFTP